jgi:hypothetical protein
MSGEKIFMSYASVDRPRIELLVKTLASQDLDVWWDRDIPRGKSFNRVIEDALQQARCVIVVWSRESIASEWVFNEASDARKRQILVPVLIDDVEPPLEFRHLQAARLVDWRGDPGDREWTGLLEAVRGLLQQPDVTPAAAMRVTPVAAQKHWWQTPAGMALGAGALLGGLAVLLIALKQVGLLGGAAQSSPTATLPAAVVPPVVQAPATTQAVAVVPPAAAPQTSGAAKEVSGGANAAAVHTNLLDPEEGGKLVIANEDAWRQVMERKLQTAVIGNHGFAVFAFRDEKPALIDTVAVYVESTSRYNLKELAVYASDQSETGPFRKIAVLTVPNYRNMRAPLHEFKVDPFTARYVKVELLSWQEVAGLPNGYVGNLQLLGTLR